VIEEEIDIEILSTDFKVVLASRKGEADTQFEEEVTDVFYQAPFQITFQCIVAQREEVKVVRVFEHLPRKVGLRRGERAREVGDGLAQPLVEAAIDLIFEDCSAPPMLDCRPYVLFALRRVFHPVQQHAIMKPRNLSSNLLDK
jgi:hypothetical protein